MYLSCLKLGRRLGIVKCQQDALRQFNSVPGNTLENVTDEYKEGARQ